MSLNKQELLSRIDNQAALAASSRVRSLLDSTSARPTSADPVHSKVGEVLRLWETRLENTQFTAKPIQGARSLIVNLKKLPPDAIVEQFGFIASGSVGSLFFDLSNGQFLGDTIVSRSKQPKRPAADGERSGTRQAKSA